MNKNTKLTWSYRVIRTVLEKHNLEIFAVHSVHYEDGIPSAVSEEPTHPQGDTFEELKGDLELYKLAFTKPVLEYQYFCDLNKSKE